MGDGMEIDVTRRSFLLEKVIGRGWAVIRRIRAKAYKAGEVAAMSLAGAALFWVVSCVGFGMTTTMMAKTFNKVRKINPF